MDKEQLIYYVESLGFKRSSEYSFEGVHSTCKDYYFFGGREDVVVEIHQVLDYYTSHWGNHPYHYEVKVYLRTMELYSCKISKIDFYELLESIDYAFDRLGHFPSSNTSSFSVRQYDGNRKRVMSQITREGKLKILGI
jgi:hypothetical protein